MPSSWRGIGAVGAERCARGARSGSSDYKVPETIMFSAEPLPRNANGKVMKRQLREAFAAS